MLGAALGLAPARPRAAWLVALLALLAVAAFEAISLPLYALVAGHAFFCGRTASLRAGLLRSAALVVAVELGALRGTTPEWCRRCS